MQSIVFIAILLSLCGCPAPLFKPEPPRDQFDYPAMFVQEPDVAELSVVSINNLKRYSSGSLIKLDLTKVDALLATTTQPIPTPDILVPDSTQLIDTFATSPWLSGGRMFLLSGDSETFFSADQTVRTRLKWPNPNFLQFFSPLQNGDQQGIIAYVKPAMRQTIDVNSPENNFGELQFFTLAQGETKIRLQKEIRIEPWLPLDEKPDSDKNNYVSDDISGFPTRRISHVGAMRVLNDRLIVAVESPLSYTNMQSAETAAHLLSIPLSRIKDPTSTSDMITYLNLNPVHTSKSIVDFDLSMKNKVVLYAIARQPGTLIQVDLDASYNFSYRDNRATRCGHPVAVQVSTDETAILLACDSGEVFAYDDNLQVVGENKSGGLLPTNIWFDKRRSHPQRFYVSYRGSGTIGVFDLVNENNRIKFLGQIGQTAKPNHPGGI